MQSPLEPGVTIENFRRLHKGMTKEEVETVLGSDPKYRLGRWAEHWRTDDLSITILMDDDRFVTSGCCHLLKDGGGTYREIDEGTFEKVRRWVKDRTGW
jgi:hypothetical protein